MNLKTLAIFFMIPFSLFAENIMIEVGKKNIKEIPIEFSIKKKPSKYITEYKLEIKTKRKNKEKFKIKSVILGIMTKDEIPVSTIGLVEENGEDGENQDKVIYTFSLNTNYLENSYVTIIDTKEDVDYVILLKEF